MGPQDDTNCLPEPIIASAVFSVRLLKARRPHCKNVLHQNKTACPCEIAHDAVGTGSQESNAEIKLNINLV